MTATNNIFTQMELSKGFVLLIFTDFEKCMEAFRESMGMQGHVFFDTDTIAHEIPDFPYGITIIAPTQKSLLGNWNCAFRQTKVSLGQEGPLKLEEIQTSPPAVGRKIAFLFTAEGAKELGLA